MKKRCAYGNWQMIILALLLSAVWPSQIVLAQQPGVAAPVEEAPAAPQPPEDTPVEPEAEAGPPAPPTVSNQVAAPPAADDSTFDPNITFPGNPYARPAEGQVVPPTSEGAPRGYITYKTPWEVYLTASAIVVLGITLGVLAFMGRGGGLTPDFIRAFILITIIFAALFLIAAGYSDEQAAPVYGLLGTILGYLFGRTDPTRKDTAPAAPPATEGAAAPTPTTQTGG